MFDVVALGETLIDFTPSGVNAQGVALYGCNPGGAPANLLAMNAKLGGKTAFIGKVGRDTFGDFLQSTMQSAGIDVSGLTRAEDVHTTLAFVHLDAGGNRSFSFYRKPGADVCLAPEDVPEALLRACRVFHFGSVSMTDQPSRAATLYGAQKAREYGALVSYDPNFRPALWQDASEAARVMAQGLALADVVKVAEEEMTLLTGETDLARGAQALCAHGACLALVTGGEKGAYYRTPACHGAVPAYNVPVVDTTGAGDAFLGALLYCLRGLDKNAIAALPQARLEDMLRYANAAGGLTATARGAIPAMPDDAAIRHCLQTCPPRADACFA